MTRWLLWAVTGLGSCQCNSAPPVQMHPPPDDSREGGIDDDYRPSVYDWLPGTNWICDWVYARNGTLYRVPHTWQFTDTEFRSDCGQQIEAAYSGGEISYSAYWEAQWWVEVESGALYSADLHPWYGMSATVILAEFCPVSTGDCEGFEIIFHRDGEEHMAIQIGIDGVLTSSISCERASTISTGK